MQQRRPVAKAGDGDFLRSVAEAVVQLLMEADAEGMIGAGRHERSGDRTTYRNGYQDRCESAPEWNLRLHASQDTDLCLKEVLR